MTKTAWVFPGQGSQVIGMGVDLAKIPEAKAKFERAESILGWSVLKRCQEDEDKLAQTLYTQPCLYVIECLLVDLLKAQGKSSHLVAGHSLGEYVALYAADVFDFESGLGLVKKRAELMTEAKGGMMAALMKFDREQLQTEIDKTPDVVLANDNSEQQVVISGTPDAVKSVMENVKARRAVALKVSGAFHSPLMASAAEQFQGILEATPFTDAAVPVLSNIEPTPAVESEILKERLLKQMTGSVRWREIMLRFPQEEVSEVLEVGPGKVLTGLIKRTCKGLTVGNISGKADIEG